MYVRNREVCWKKGDFSSFFYQSLILLLNAGRGRVFLRGTQLFLILEHLACLPWNFTVQEPATCSHWRKLKSTIGVVWFLHRKSSKGLGSGATQPPCHWVPWPHFYARSDVGLEGHRVLVWVPGSCPNWQSYQEVQGAACRKRLLGDGVGILPQAEKGTTGDHQE